ncbi:hypothetical protein HanIR_Chr14g0688311 [Helianthus annuus]|nr:hypothetical protein HanIR_Chr14g0688311 [Helianthus annuus]
MASSRLLLRSPTLRSIFSIHHRRSASTAAVASEHAPKDPKEGHAKLRQVLRDYAKKVKATEHQGFRQTLLEERAEYHKKREQMEKKRLLRRQSDAWFDENELEKQIFDILYR